jgi:glycosyltransferase involved in cell wall biosynthesis
VGGIETYSFEFARELAVRGYDVTVFTISHPKGQCSAPGIKVIPNLKLNRKLDAKLLKDFGMDLWHVTNAAYAWLALETEPVVVSVHGNDFISPYIFVEQAVLYSVPWIWRVQSWSRTLDIWLARKAACRLMGRALPQARHVIANSRYTEATLLQHFPSCRGKTSVGFVGVSDDYFTVKTIPRDRHSPRRFITVCRLSDKRKNVDLVLRSLAKICHYDFTYTIIGDGPLRPRLEELSHKLGLTDRVEFLGFVPREQLQKRLASSDLFVLTASLLPSSHEGFGIVYLEANACGIPVLAARQAGAAEAVADGVSGMFVQVPTVDAVSSALEQFLSGTVRFDSGACKAFARRFTWQRVVNHAIQFYGTSNGKH